MIVIPMKFNELAAGDWFSSEGGTCIKVKTDAFNAGVNVYSGEVSFFKNDDSVFKLPRLEGDICKKIEDPTKAVLVDGFIYVIAEDDDGYYGTGEIICPEYDKPIRLSDIEEDYGHNRIVFVITECALHGEIYRFDNYNDGCWYRVGRTCGYA